MQHNNLLKILHANRNAHRKESGVCTNIHTVGIFLLILVSLDFALRLFRLEPLSKQDRDMSKAKRNLSEPSVKPEDRDHTSALSVGYKCWYL